MTRPMLDTPPMYSFTEAQLRAAYRTQVDAGWTGDVGRTAAAMTLIGCQAPDDAVEHIAGMIRQAVEEGR